MPSWGTMLADSLRVPVLGTGSWLLAPAVALLAVSVLYYGMILALRLDTSRTN
jgi:ABC-type dipeptide/oligopeptide/nickel transport system permease subunit